MPDQSSAASEHALLQEITAPLQTLPDDPLAFVEAEFPTSMRGYDRHAVDDYVEQVSRLVAELHATRSPESAVRRALERVGDQISGILQRAHETAEQITSQSRNEAEDRLEQARREATTMVDAAAQRVRELDADADRIWGERQRIIADAEDLSGQLQAVTREAAERFPPVDDVRGTPARGETGDLEPAFDDLPAARGEAPAGAEDDGWSAAEDDGWSAADVGLVDSEADAPADAPPEYEPEHEYEPALQPEPEPEPAAEHESPVAPPGDRDPADGERDEPDDYDIEATRRFEPQRLTDDDSTQIIPPASDAAQHRRDH